MFSRDKAIKKGRISVHGACMVLSWERGDRADEIMRLQIDVIRRGNYNLLTYYALSNCMEKRVSQEVS